MRQSHWYGLDICNKCHRRLNVNDKMCSGGICPKCGYNNKSTVCKTIKVVLKETKHYQWWKFWDRKRTYEGKDNFSKGWLTQSQLH